MPSRRRRTGRLEAEAQDAWAETTGATVPIDNDGTVVVHFPGWRNRSAGPDFRDAVIEAQGETVRGDVEVHRDARDWVRHGHEADPRYANVVLHVVDDASGDPPGPARRARVASLADASVVGAPMPFACRGGFVREPETVRRTLVAVGMARYRVAAARISARLGGPLADVDGAVDQIVFEEIAAAYGFAGNEGAMRRCAQAVPLTTIRAMGTPGPGETDPAYQAILAAAIGGGERFPTRLDPSGSVGGRELIRWVLAGVRPSNHPRRRLAQVVAIARAWPNWGMREAVREALRATAHVPRRAGPRLRALVAPNASARSRASDVVVNVLLPLGRAVAVRDGDARAIEWADAAYAAHATLSGNAVIARVAGRVGGGPRQVAHTAAAQQGLIAIWDGPCRPLRCDLCPLTCPDGSTTPG